MRRTLLAVALCAAGLLAGCGSSTKPAHQGAAATTTGSSTAPHGPVMATPGAAGKVGPGTSGKYDASNGAVLFHIRIALVQFFTSKGFSGVTAQCNGVSTQVASCQISGTNRSYQTSSAVLTLAVNQSNGVLRITHVKQ